MQLITAQYYHKNKQTKNTETILLCTVGESTNLASNIATEVCTHNWRWNNQHIILRSIDNTHVLTQSSSEDLRS